MQKTMGGRRFVEWEEQFVSHDRGSRIVHYFLKDQHGSVVLAVIGTERSLRHMVYVVADEFLNLPVLAKPSNSSFKWRSRREVVDWLTSLLSKPRASTASSGDYTTKFTRHESSRISDTDLSNGEDMDEPDSNGSNYKDKIPRKIRATSKGITWLGSSWTCRKRLRHYESFRRSGITISVNDYVYVMAEEKIHHIAYLEDLYEDKKAQKKVRVRWFHRTNEVVGNIPPPPAHEAEVFITPFRQVLSVECVDGVATILTPEHYEKSLVKLPSELVAQIHVCFRQFDNEGIKPFNLNEMQGYWHQKVLKSIDLAYPQEYSKHELSDSIDLDEEDVVNGTTLKKYPRRNRCTRRRLGASNRVYEGKLEEKNRAISGNIYRPKPALDSGAHESQSMSFDIGDNIELLCQDSSIRGCWFRCTIIEKVPNRLKVSYKDVLNEDGSDHLKEWVPSFRIAIPDKWGIRATARPTIRPCPPEDRLGSFEVGTAVDAWWNDGWWEGIVVMIEEAADELEVFFPGENIYSTFKKCDLRPSREWVGNQWIGVEKNADVAAKVIGCDTKQGFGSGVPHSSILSNDYSFYVSSGELRDHIDSSDRKLCIISQIAARESRKLGMFQNTLNDYHNTMTLDVKEEEMSDPACSDHNDLGDALASKNMRMHGSFSNMDASRSFTLSKQVGLDLDSTLEQRSPENSMSIKRETCSPSNDGLRTDLRWKSYRKRQRAGDSALLSRSAISCGKEESKRFSSSKLVDTPDIKNGRDSILASTKDVPKGQEDMVDVSSLKQGHDNLQSIHGASISDTIFMSSMPVANLVMSR